MLCEQGVEQRCGVIVILALVLQRAVKSEQQAAVGVRGIGHIIDVLTDFLLRQCAAIDGEVIHQCLRFIIHIGSTNNDGVVADAQRAVFSIHTYKQAVHIEADVVFLFIGIVGEGDMMPHTPIFNL